jgi:hypothetical protein
MKLSRDALVEPQFQRFCELLLCSKIRRHAVWLPCCQVYADGGDLEPDLMSEFLEYVRNELWP